MEKASVAEVKAHIDAGNKLAEETYGQTAAVAENIGKLDPSALADGIDALAADLEGRAKAASELPYGLIEEKRVEAHDTAAAALHGTSTDFAKLAPPHEATKKANGEAHTSMNTFATALGEVAASLRGGSKRLREEAAGHVTAGVEKANAAGTNLNGAKESALKYRTNL